MPHEIYYSLKQNQVATFTKPIKGWRFCYITEDGYLGRDSEVDPDTLEAEDARCAIVDTLNATLTLRDKMTRGAIPELPAIHHDRNCRCGYRICDARDTLAGYLHWMTEETPFGDVRGNRADGLHGVAICSVEGYGTAVHRDLTDPEPLGTLRFTNYRLTGKAYIPREWAGEPIPDSLVNKFAENFPSIEVKRVDQPHTLPGTRPRRPPTPTGDARHPSGRWGRYGAAHALIRHNSRFLLVDPVHAYAYRHGATRLDRRGRGRWQLPGGALKTPNEAFLAAALRETDEETCHQLASYTKRGRIKHREGDWKHKTFALDADRFRVRAGDISWDVAAADWFTLDEIRALNRSRNLDPELVDDLPELLEMFD